MHRRIAIALFVMTICSGCANHGSQNKAEKDFILANYSSALPHYQTEATKGDPEAQYVLGYMNYYGLGVKKDVAKAEYWIKKSAAQGYAKAQQALKLVSNT